MMTETCQMTKMEIKMKTVEIDSAGLSYRELNDLMREGMLDGAEKIILKNVTGQKFIGTRLYFPKASKTVDSKKLEIEIFGTPGNDLGAFLHGHSITVFANAQDGVGNTMENGEIVVHGRAGDVVAMAMRGGKIFIRDSLGYRAAMHMKEYEDKTPVLVIGGTAQDFLGEYMAGGIVILLGIGDQEHRANFIGTGMHNGVIYIRGQLEEEQLGKGVIIQELDEHDHQVLKNCVGEFVNHFGAELDVKAEELLQGEFVKLVPASNRPYKAVYAN